MTSDLPPLPLPKGISSRTINTSPYGLNFHILEAGYTPTRLKPLILLLHGFPDLAYSWRHVIPLLASAGYYVVAPDQRGYGRTSGWDTSGFSQVNLQEFSMIRLVTDIVVLVNALGYRKVTCLVGHDFGAVAAAHCAVSRPDLFEKLVLMSHPFKGTLNLPFNTANGAELPSGPVPVDMEAELAKLDRPRKHYRWYYSSEVANEEMLEPKDTLHDFLRGYFHLKSADWEGNDPQPLKGWEADEFAKMPVYYVMDKEDGMRAAVAREMKREDSEIISRKGSRWLSDEELGVYVQEFSRTGFQGGLNWYRVQTDAVLRRDTALLAGRKIEVPCFYVSGLKDWGNHQEPGSLKKMKDHCTRLVAIKFIEGAGHWLPQEQPREATNAILGAVSENI
ncbi:putative epoxide hydrolase [Phaeomoniella chlamydospora]|uniref:Putative epoxide hydrolase n=1 Tax=Phaeomoniella chlamydospora TaxID=158046 RepID=A0A0G2GQZ4_PHACM|nr:putative epoxide hydrolase [Phaeomoniella chlamydospora]